MGGRQYIQLQNPISFYYVPLYSVENTIYDTPRARVLRQSLHKRRRAPCSENGAEDGDVLLCASQKQRESKAGTQREREKEGLYLQSLLLEKRL